MCPDSASLASPVLCFNCHFTPLRRHAPMTKLQWLLSIVHATSLWKSLLLQGAHCSQKVSCWCKHPVLSAQDLHHQNSSKLPMSASHQTFCTQLELLSQLLTSARRSLCLSMLDGLGPCCGSQLSKFLRLRVGCAPAWGCSEKRQSPEAVSLLLAPVLLQRFSGLKHNRDGSDGQHC